jgi:hypothetical protein
MRGEKNNQMVSVCGVVCSDCPAYSAASKGIDYQRIVAEAWLRIYELRESAEDISCGGCLGGDDELFSTCKNCRARLCCLDKGMSSCAECPEVACEILEKAQSMWDGVPGLVTTLSSADFATYAKPYCGHRQRLAAARAKRR